MSGRGVFGTSETSIGVYGFSQSSQGVRGYSASDSGVLGVSDTATGVRGESPKGVAVYGLSSTGYSVVGNNLSPNRPAVLGHSTGHGTGVLGFSGASVVAAKAKTGVHGYAAQDATSVGVLGESTSGVGVRAAATTATPS